LLNHYSNICFVFYHPRLFSVHIVVIPG
jgi:hypothetical protein